MPKKIDPAMLAHCFCPSPFGRIGVLWSFQEDQPRIVRILFSGPDSREEPSVRNFYANSKLDTCSAMDSVVQQIEAFLDGNDITFSLNRVRLDLCSDFQRRVLLADYRIPRGRVSTYQRMARFLGNPSAARAVGTALATNPFPIIIPCHRVIRSDRTLGGYRGGLSMKRALLEKEGVSFDPTGHVVTGDLYYS